MKKNKKVLLTIITILLSAVLFTNKVNAIVMWMQCTATADDEMNHNDIIDENTRLYKDGNHDYKKYNTIIFNGFISGNVTKSFKS